MHPESHLRYHAERHADLLREARQVERVSSLGEMRRTHPKLRRPAFGISGSLADFPPAAHRKRARPWVTGALSLKGSQR